MHLIATWLTKRGLSDGLAGLLAWVIPILVVLGAIWWLRADAYSDGVKASDIKWEKALKKAEDDLRKGASKASEASEVRKEGFRDKVTREAKEMEDAESKGASPFDVLFPSKWGRTLMDPNCRSYSVGLVDGYLT